VRTTRIVLISSCIIITGLLFLLPKAVVENDAATPQDSSASAHSSIPAQDQAKINSLRSRLLSNGADGKNSAIFADSLGFLYAAAGRPDSAAIWLDQAATLDPNASRQLNAADAWLQASAMSLEPEKSEEMARRAQSLFQQVLEGDPKNLDVKVKLAMTYMSSAAPMQGVAMLREVLEADPKHEQALLSMGILSLRSGQFAKAVDWFTRLTKAHPENEEGQLLLGKALAETGEKEKAREQYERARKTTKDPAVQQQLEQFIKELDQSKP
jgi:outer membrane protein